MHFPQVVFWEFNFYQNDEQKLKSFLRYFFERLIFIKLMMSKNWCTRCKRNGGLLNLHTNVSLCAKFSWYFYDNFVWNVSIRFTKHLFHMFTVYRFLLLTLPKIEVGYDSKNDVSTVLPWLSLTNDSGLKST